MEQISNGVIIGLIVEAVVVILLPIVLLILWKVKTRCKLMPALVGAIIFVVFALILEGIPKQFLFAGSNGVSVYILNHNWAYIVCGCLLAGIFEELGRFVAFKFFLKKHQGKETAITYGIGHGGIEAILLVGLSAISTVMLAVTVNSGAVDAMMEMYTAEQAQLLTSQVSVVAAMTAGSIVLATLERIFALILHISLSVVVFAGVQQKGKGWLVVLAILLHALFDVPAVLYQVGVCSLLVCEIALGVLAILIAVLAYGMYRKLSLEGSVGVND